MLLGYPSSGAIYTSSKLTDIANYYGLYIQDDFRATAKLTINIGMRWEHEPGVYEQNNGMIVNFDGSVIAHGTTGRADEIITAEVRPDLVREARIHWGVENNIYQLWHRGYVAVKGGAMDCPYTFMQDMVAGTFRLPWEDQVKVTDGTPCGFPVPTLMFGPKTAKAAE